MHVAHVTRGPSTLPFLSFFAIIVLLAALFTVRFLCLVNALARPRDLVIQLPTYLPTLPLPLPLYQPLFDLSAACGLNGIFLAALPLCLSVSLCLLWAFQLLPP